MYRSFLTYFAHNKYRLTMFFLLAGATVFSVAVWRVRAEFSGSARYGFLIWNLFLAWIPFIISYFTFTLTLKRRWIYFFIPAAAFLWLIFFPNAPYILTDFQHLAHTSSDLPVWYDVMMLIWFAFTGLLLGMVSLFLMQEIIRREFGRWVGWTFVVLVAGLSAAGVYMGRFLRWNSWDVLTSPGGLLADTWTRVANPSDHPGTFAIVVLFTSFLTVAYAAFYSVVGGSAERGRG